MPNVQETALSSEEENDRIIVCRGFDTFFGYLPLVFDKALPVGIFSLDGGNTWNDCANYNFSGGFTIQPSSWTDIFSELVINSGVERLLIDPYNDGLFVKLAVLALPDISYSDSNIPNVEGDTLYTSEDSYLKIAQEGSFNRNASSYGVTTIPHGLGYVPLANVWVESDWYGSSGSAIFRIFNMFSQFSNSGIGVTVDENNIYIHTEPGIYGSNSTIKVYYRIYKEE